MSLFSIILLKISIYILFIDSWSYLKLFIIFKNFEISSFLFGSCLDKRTFKLEDVACIKDLEEIKETFSEWWTISNYDEMLEICKNNEEEEALKNEKEKLICFIRNNASIEQLKEFKESIKWQEVIL